MNKTLTVLLMASTAFTSQAEWPNIDPTTSPDGAGTPLPVLIGTATDATGDAFGLMSPNLDISALSANIVGSNMVIQMDFSTPVSSPESGNPDSVIGFIEIDADQNSATGTTTAYDVFCPQPTDLGVEYTIDLGTVSAGMVNINDSIGPIGTAPISYTANSFTIDLPMALIGNPNNVHMASVIGTGPEPTDCVPDNAILAAGTPSVSVPSLSQWMQMLMALLIAAFSVVYIRKTNS